MTSVQRKTISLKNPFVLILIFMIIVGGLGLFGSHIKKALNIDDSKLDHYNLPPALALSKNEATLLNDSCNLWYENNLNKSCFNGGIIIAKNGNIVFEKYRGEARLGSGIPFSDSSSIHIASTSKTFTAMAVLKLMQDGKVNIDDEFSNYFPGFPYPGVTIRTLLNHRSGLPNYLVFMEKLGWDKSIFIRNTDVLTYLITRKNEIENIGLPDKHFSYCNTNYALLALLIEKLSNLSYPVFMQQTFFGPLGMKHTFVYTDQDSSRANPSYECTGTIIRDNFLDRVYGDKNIYSTPRDILTWDKTLRSNIIFTPETMSMAYTPYSNEKEGVRNYGLGWRMFLYPGGRKIIYHNGWWHGSTSCFIRLTDENATIIVLGSQYSKMVYKAKDLVNIFHHYDVPEEEE